MTICISKKIFILSEIYDIKLLVYVFVKTWFLYGQFLWRTRAT